MKSLIAALVFGLAVAVTVSAESPTTPDEKKADEKKAEVSLEGGYTLVSGEKDGKAIPEDHIKGSIVKFTGDKIIGTDKDKKEFFSSTFKLDTTKKPWAITMTSKEPKEATAKGLIKKEGDTITIIYALPGGETPTEFKTKKDQNMFVLKNMNKGGKEPNKFTKD